MVFKGFTMVREGSSLFKCFRTRHAGLLLDSSPIFQIHDLGEDPTLHCHTTLSEEYCYFQFKLRIDSLNALLL